MNCHMIYYTVYKHLTSNDNLKLLDSLSVNVFDRRLSFFVCLWFFFVRWYWICKLVLRESKTRFEIWFMDWVCLEHSQCAFYFADDSCSDMVRRESLTIRTKSDIYQYIWHLLFFVEAANTKDELKSYFKRVKATLFENLCVFFLFFFGNQLV